jgi:hypothetical protein
MSDRSKRVYLQPEEYKTGWVHGFYDAKSDDGAFYGNSNGTSHAGSAHTHPGEAARLYNDGYRDGRATRIAGDLRQSRSALRGAMEQSLSCDSLSIEPTAKQTELAIPRAPLRRQEAMLDESVVCP